MDNIYTPFLSSLNTVLINYHNNLKRISDFLDLKTREKVRKEEDEELVKIRKTLKEINTGN